MEIPIYLALTATEFRSCGALPPHSAWLSCLFSPYGRGLSNIPKQLPPHSLMILSDRTPVCGHDPGLIKDTLAEVIERLSCSGLLLDFERPDNEEAIQIAKTLTALPCPVAVSSLYAKELTCPVFVPAPPPSQLPERYLSPWADREIWLEIGTQAQKISITESGATFTYVMPPFHLPHHDAELCCHYTTELTDRSATFTLQRTREDWEALLTSSHFGQISRAIGLFQEFA